MSGIVAFLEARISEDEGRASKHLPAARSHGLGDYPIRVLQESATKRAIIESYKNVCKASKSMNLLDTKLTISGMEEGLRVALAALTFPYNDHADWQPEWAEL